MTEPFTLQTVQNCRIGGDMKPVICQVRHDPPQSYGDCARACVASILELPPEKVPHWFANEDGFEANKEMREWLSLKGYMLSYFALQSGMTLEAVLNYVDEWYGDIEFILLAETRSGGDHAVVCQSGKIIHDPAWYKTAIIGPHSSGMWIIMMLTKL